MKQTSLSSWSWQVKVAVVSCVVFVLDQVSKFGAQLAGWPMVLNSGVSFGWRPAGEWLTLGLVVLVGVGVAVSWQQYHRAPIISGLFLGGVLANLTDRIFLGGVRDWLALPFTGLYNNVADWAIALAVIIALQRIFLKK